MNVNRIKQITLATFLVTFFSGCSWLPALDEVVTDSSNKYQKAETLPPLDIPPDLSTSRINDEFAEKDDGASYSDYAESADNPLAAKYNVAPSTKPALTGEGGSRHLIVYGQSAVLWQQMLDFWAENGMNVKRQDETLGLMDTAADADGYAFRTRVDSGDLPNTLEMYIGAANFDSNEQKNEAKLRQLAEYMGTQHRADRQQLAAVQQQQQVSQPQAFASINAVIIDEAGDHQALTIDRDFDTMWRSVGRIVDSKYFIVQDRERDRGVYFVQYLDPFLIAKQGDESMFSKLAFWQSEMDVTPDMFFYIKLVADADETKIIILDIDQVRTSSASAKRLLRLIQEELGR
jgi:outer membrane protein assembly factor BamC